MLTTKQIDRYADVLLWGLRKARTRTFKKNDIVLVRYHLAAIKLAEALQAKLMDMKLNTVMRMVATPVMEHTFFDKANPRQLVFEAPGDRELFKNLNGNIFLNAPDCLTHLQRINPSKIAKAAMARKPLVTLTVF